VINTISISNEVDNRSFVAKASPNVFHSNKKYIAIRAIAEKTTPIIYANLSFSLEKVQRIIVVAPYANMEIHA